MENKKTTGPGHSQSFHLFFLENCFLNDKEDEKQQQEDRESSFFFFF